jgi:hypothetical protein
MIVAEQNSTPEWELILLDHFCNLVLKCYNLENLYLLSLLSICLLHRYHRHNLPLTLLLGGLDVASEKRYVKSIRHLNQD